MNSTKLLISTFIVSALISMNVYAGGKHRHPVIKKCSSIRTPEVCTAVAQFKPCFWDAADQRCESKHNDEDRCNLLSNLRDCTANLQCFWDHDDQRCESR
jgi:hypothetical protein